MTIKLGLQIPNFSYGTGVAELFPTVIAQAQEADAAGFDSVFVMDHFYQLPGLGTPDQPMLEAYTALGGLATATERVQLGTLVTGNTYRNPTLLAKAITTLDVMSQGRAILGIGTGWFELEHDFSASSSAPSPTASTSSTRRCRSSFRCSRASGRRSPASTTAPRRRWPIRASATTSR